MQQSLLGKIIFYKLASEFGLFFDLKATHAEVPQTLYPKMMELKVQAFDMAVVTLLGPNLWRPIQQYGLAKFKIHP